MNPPTNERIKELRDVIVGASHKSLWLHQAAENDLLSILQDYSAMRAENETLKAKLHEWEMLVTADYIMGYTKMEAENERLRGEESADRKSVV
jgi:hypothetical protein